MIWIKALWLTSVKGWRMKCSPIISYLNFAFQLQFPSNSLFLCMFHLKKECSNGQYIWLLDHKLFDLLPQLNNGDWWNCSPKCFQSELTWNLISRCSAPSNSMFLYFIWRKDAQTVKKMTCWPFEQVFRPLTSVKGWRMVWLNCNPRGFDSNDNLPELFYLVAISPIIHCSSGEMELERYTIEFVERSSSKKRILVSKCFGSVTYEKNKRLCLHYVAGTAKLTIRQWISNVLDPTLFLKIYGHVEGHMTLDDFSWTAPLRCIATL